MSSGMRTEIIVHAIDVVHVRHVNESAELLMETAVVQPVAELRAALSLEGIDEIIKLIIQVEKRERATEEEEYEDDENYFDLT